VDPAQAAATEDPTAADAAGVVGELIQIDGCEHHWFEDRAPMCTALVFVDAATSRLMFTEFGNAFVSACAPVSEAGTPAPEGTTASE
jgi:hypothetical protein